MSPAAAEGAGGAPRQRANPLWTVLRMGLMYYFFKNFFGGPSKPVPRSEMFVPKFEKGLLLDLNVYLSESPAFRCVIHDVIIVVNSERDNWTWQTTVENPDAPRHLRDINILRCLQLRHVKVLVDGLNIYELCGICKRLLL